MIDDRTISDFGEQWTHYQSNEGYYASEELFADIVMPLLSPSELKCTSVAEIGAGSGRISQMLVRAGCSKVLALEPSDAFPTLERNLFAYAGQVEFLQATGDKLPARNFDYVFSVGVLHHIRKPDDAVKAAHRALRKGGRFFVWLYGKEGNHTYLSLALPLRAITKWLPHPLLASLVWILYGVLRLYVTACRHLPIPMRRYMLDVIDKLEPKNQRLVIYDQLNPAYAKYYSREEAIDLLARNGFEEVQAFHRHGYSWSVIGTKQ